MRPLGHLVCEMSTAHREVRKLQQDHARQVLEERVRISVEKTNDCTHPHLFHLLPKSGSTHIPVDSCERRVTNRESA